MKSPIKNHIRATPVLCALSLLCALLSTACPNPAGESGEDSEQAAVVNGLYTLDFTVAEGETKYLSLTGGNFINSPSSPEWDIAFQETRLVYTNSGDTAKDLATGGYGGVWHTNQTDFDAVTGRDAAVTGPDPLDGRDYGEYNQDAKRWTTVMSGPRHKSINVMTYAGYTNENEVDGKTEYSQFGIFYKYNKKQFYANTFEDNGSMTMPPNFYPTGQVYIIRHGNGAEYSRLQVTKFERDFTKLSDHYTIQWKKIDE
jgi:hypothetical protein